MASNVQQAPTLPKGKGLHATEILPVWHNSPLLRLASLQNQNAVLVEITQSKLNDYSVINLQTALLLWAKYGALFWWVFMAEITTFAALWRTRRCSLQIGFEFWETETTVLYHSSGFHRLRLLCEWKKCMRAKLLQSLLTRCDTMDCSLPGSLESPWDSPGKNTEVGCHALLRGTFPTQGYNPPSPQSRALAGGFYTTSATWEWKKAFHQLVVLFRPRLLMAFWGLQPPTSKPDTQARNLPGVHSFALLATFISTWKFSVLSPNPCQSSVSFKNQSIFHVLNPSLSYSKRFVLVSLKAKNAFIWNLLQEWSPSGLPWWLLGKESTCQCRKHGLNPWSGKIPHAEERSACVPRLETVL